MDVERALSAGTRRSLRWTAVTLCSFRDGSAVQWVGVGVQVVLLAGYLGITVIGETEFAVRFLVPGIITSVTQVALAGLLTYLALTRGRVPVTA